jgi:chromosome segregation ATPase
VQKQLQAHNALGRFEKRVVRTQMARNESEFQQRLQRATKSTERYLKSLENELQEYEESLARGQSNIEQCASQLNHATREVSYLANIREKGSKAIHDSLPMHQKALEEAQAKQARRMEKQKLCQMDITEVTSRLARLQNGDEEAVQEVEKIQQELAKERLQQPKASTST